MEASIKVDRLNINPNRYARYCDVIVGNGKSIIEFQPEVPCFFNDSNTDVVNFYKNIHDSKLIVQLNDFTKKWDLIAEFSSFSLEEIKMSYHDFQSGIISSEDLNFMLRAIIMMNMDSEQFNLLFEKNFVISIDMLINSLIKHIESGLIGLKGDNQIIEQCNFLRFLEQTFKYGFYEHFKTLMNLQKTELIDCLDLNSHLTLWFYLKELSKGSHLSYDQNGNIKNQYDREVNLNKIKDKLHHFENQSFIATIQSATLSNNTLNDFISQIKPDLTDLLVANLESGNLVLSTGKNHSSLKTEIDIIRPLMNLQSNILIKTDTEKIANDIHSVNPESFSIIESNSCFYVLNFEIF